MFHNKNDYYMNDMQYNDLVGIADNWSGRSKERYYNKDKASDSSKHMENEGSFYNTHKEIFHMLYIYSYMFHLFQVLFRSFDIRWQRLHQDSRGNQNQDTVDEIYTFRFHQIGMYRIGF